MFVICDCIGLARADVYAKYGKCCKQILMEKHAEQMAELHSMTVEMYHQTSKSKV